MWPLHSHSWRLQRARLLFHQSKTNAHTADQLHINDSKFVLATLSCTQEGNNARSRAITIWIQWKFQSIQKNKKSPVNNPQRFWEPRVGPPKSNRRACLHSLLSRPMVPQLPDVHSPSQQRARRRQKDTPKTQRKSSRCLEPDTQTNAAQDTVVQAHKERKMVDTPKNSNPRILPHIPTFLGFFQTGDRILPQSFLPQKF